MHAGAAAPGVAARAAAALERAWWHGGPLAWALRPLAWLFGALVAARRLGYRRGWLASHHPGVPVVVVGNRIVGGAGKTPTTLAIVAALRERGWRPGIVSRGHGGSARGPIAVGPGRRADEVGDEPLLLARRSGVPLWVGRDRVAAAQALRAAAPEVDVIVCDDGAQHLRLARDVEVLVFDERGAGNGALLPAGPLREPLGAPSTARAALVLYNAAQASTALPGHHATRRLGAPVALAAWWAGDSPVAYGAAADDAWVALRGPGVWACAGIAAPQRFFAALRAAGVKAQELALPDHANLDRLPWPAEARAVVLTEKDAVKLDPARLARERPQQAVWVVPLVLEPEAAFFDALFAALGPAAARPGVGAAR